MSPARATTDESSGRRHRQKASIPSNSQDSQDIVGGASSETRRSISAPRSILTLCCDRWRRWNRSYLEPGLMKQVAVLQGHADKVYSVCFRRWILTLTIAAIRRRARNPNTGEEICRFVGHARGSSGGLCRPYMVRRATTASRIRDALRSDSGNQRQGNRNPGIGLALQRYDHFPSGLGLAELDHQKTAKPTRPPGRPKGVELARFEAGSPVFSVDVSEDLVYIVGGCQDGMARVWRVPGNARYYGDSSSSNYQQGNYGLGSDPLAEPGSYGSGSGSGSSPY